jgi:putative Holliday junction resolvase
MPDTPEGAARGARYRGNSEILLAFDFGLRRVGVATGNLLTGTASALTTLETRNGPPWPAIDAVVADYAPGTLVVGMPPASTAPTAVAERVRRFVGALRERYDLPVETVDEGLTSRAAESELREARRGGARARRLGKDSVDRVAARLIAEQWINERARGGAPS